MAPTGNAMPDPTGLNRPLTIQSVSAITLFSAPR
jgi:hypothetical protein